MIVTNTISDARASRSYLGKAALVPTMGALHQGHLSLIRVARQHAPIVIVSIFVNPTQFGPREDFNKYPRPIEEDLRKCEEAGVDVVFAPTLEQMYPYMKSAPEKAPAEVSAASATPQAATMAIPPGHDIQIDLPSLTTVLEGKQRPGHFKGVCQVVAKLFNIIQPDVVCFGQKDYQQFRVLQAMASALNWPIHFVRCPTIREEGGLAMSSRNQYLSDRDRQRALAISRALFQAEEEVNNGVRQTNRLTTTMQRILLEQHLQVDYAAAVDPMTLKPVLNITGPTVLAIAARVGTTRLIDNVIVSPENIKPA
jgi:pantoate ligase/cytidylate kinase